ncbi:MAG TPA: ABC transporter substrate-binding protein [Usitatibacter sp.]|nr:ABC transporter substrate-binding protein [Usitatibacter sp.]
MGLSRGVDSRRRTLLAALAALAAVGPARGAYPKVVGLIGDAGHAQEMARHMAELGYVEGRDLRFEARGAASARELPMAATALIARQPDVLLAGGSAAVVLAGFTQVIPIVCEGIADPVGARLAVSLQRPGRNVTGLSTGIAETAGAVFAMLKAMRPGVRRIAVLHSPRHPVEAQMASHARAAKAAGLEWIPAAVVGADDVERVLAPLAGEAAWLGPIHARGLAEEAVAIAKKHRIAAIGSTPGALIRHEREFSDAPRRVAAIVDRILKGTPPGEIPFELPDRHVLALDRATARAIGVEFPPEVLARATEVID